MERLTHKYYYTERNRVWSDLRATLAKHTRCTCYGHLQRIRDEGRLFFCVSLYSRFAFRQIDIFLLFKTPGVRQRLLLISFTYYMHYVQGDRFRCRPC